MSHFFCHRCGMPTAFIPIYMAQRTAGVSRSTIYYWISKDWVHIRELASGRRVICVESLSRPRTQQTD